jgi:hypothetical protein
MTWSNIPAFTDGQTVDEDDYDIYLADNSSYIKSSTPACAVYNGGAQTITTGVLTSLTWNSEEYDNDSIHDVIINPERLTIKTAGRYLIFGFVRFESNATGTRGIEIIKDGISTLVERYKDACSTNCGLTIATVDDFEVGDYIELDVWQDSGGNLDIQASPRPRFGVMWMGANDG